MKPVGEVTRGTTNANRLRRMDIWLARRFGTLLRATDTPLVVDLGYGAAPVTTVELHRRLSVVRADVRVVGLEIEPDRVALGEAVARPPGLVFRRGGFELAGLRPLIVRAANVLRQYPEEAVAGAWDLVTGSLAPGGILVDGTCDELGRLGSWVVVGESGPRTLTLAADLSTLERPAAFAERLPKALIHRNVPGERVHDVLSTLDEAWRDAAGFAVFGPRDRWRRAIAASGLPVLEPPSRWRDGVITVPWEAVAPA